MQCFIDECEDEGGAECEGEAECEDEGEGGTKGEDEGDSKAEGGVEGEGNGEGEADEGEAEVNGRSSSFRPRFFLDIFEPVP